MNNDTTDTYVCNVWYHHSVHLTFQAKTVFETSKAVNQNPRFEHKSTPTVFVQIKQVIGKFIHFNNYNIIIKSLKYSLKAYTFVLCAKLCARQ